MFYKNPQHVIDSVKATAAVYPNINTLISHRDYNKWQKKLEKSLDFESDLTNAKTFNLLNLLSTVNIEMSNPEVSRLGLPVITNLEQWLIYFPQLLTDKMFHGKIKNLDDDSFLATLSELVVAAYFYDLGNTIKFEHKFFIPTTSGNRDIDLTIEIPTKEKVHIEIYSPSIIAEDGFNALNDADEPFSKKVAFKMDDKFGDGAISGLSGKVLLAVDTYKIDMFSIRDQLTGKSSADFYTRMAAYLPSAVDGYLFFQGIISNPQSFIFEKLVLKTT